MMNSRHSHFQDFLWSWQSLPPNHGREDTAYSSSHHAYRGHALLLYDLSQASEKRHLSKTGIFQDDLDEFARVFDNLCGIHQNLLELAEEHAVERDDGIIQSLPGHLPHILMCLWIYCEHPHWPIILLCTVDGLQFPRLQAVFEEIDSEVFAMRAIERFTTDFRDVPEGLFPTDESLHQFRSLTLKLFMVCASSYHPPFVKKAWGNIGNLMRSITIGCQEGFCLSQLHYPDGLHQAQGLVSQAMSGFGAVARWKSVDTESLARKFVSQPETVVVTGQSMVYAVRERLSESCIQQLGEMLFQFVKGFELPTRCAYAKGVGLCTIVVRSARSVTGLTIEQTVAANGIDPFLWEDL
ncbi:hypothetical protein ABKN59_005114 [Abortiporus biennis]